MVKTKSRNPSIFQLLFEMSCNSSTTLGSFHCRTPQIYNILYPFRPLQETHQ